MKFSRFCRPSFQAAAPFCGAFLVYLIFSNLSRAFLAFSRRPRLCFGPLASLRQLLYTTMCALLCQPLFFGPFLLSLVDSAASPDSLSILPNFFPSVNRFSLSFLLFFVIPLTQRDYMREYYFRIILSSPVVS